MPGAVLRCQKPRTLASNAHPRGCPIGAGRRCGTRAVPPAPRIGTAGRVRRFDGTSFHPPPLIVQVVVGVEEQRRVRHFEGVPWRPQQSLRLGQPQRPCPTRLGLGRVRLGLRAWFCDRLRCPLLRWVLWRPVFRLRGRLRHAPPLGDQPLGSSRLAVDSRLLLGVPFDNSRPASHAEGSGFACQPSGVT